MFATLGFVLNILLLASLGHVVAGCMCCWLCYDVIELVKQSTCCLLFVSALNLLSHPGIEIVTILHLFTVHCDNILCWCICNLYKCMHAVASTDCKCSQANLGIQDSIQLWTKLSSIARCAILEHAMSTVFTSFPSDMLLRPNFSMLGRYNLHFLSIWKAIDLAQGPKQCRQINHHFASTTPAYRAITECPSSPGCGSS